MSRDIVFDEEKGERLMMEIADQPWIIHDNITVLHGPPEQVPMPPAMITTSPP